MKDRVQARQILEDLVNGKDLFSIPDYIDSIAVRPTREAYGYTCNKKHGPVQIMIILSKINFYEMLFIASMVDENRAKIFSECSFVPLNSFLDLLISNDVLKKWDISLHYDYGFKGWWNKKEFNKKPYMEALQTKMTRFNQDAVDAAKYTYEGFKMEEKVLENYAKIRFMTRNEAEKILDQLINDAGKKGEVTVEDFITYTGFKGFINFGYKDLIWTLADTIKGKVYQEQSGKFFIDLPEPHRKDSDEEKEKNPILSIWYDDFWYDDHMGYLVVSYNDGSEENYKYHAYSIEGKGWKDRVFEMAKYLYSFMDEVFDDVYGESAFTPDMISRNAVWMALDAIDHERLEIEYNLSDPKEYDRITDL